MTINEKGKVGIKQAFKDYWKGYFDFKGISTRAGYWWMTLINLIIMLLLTAIFAGVIYVMFTTNDNNFPNWPMFVSIGAIVIFGLATIIPSIALSVRRYRDAGLNNMTIIISYVLNILFGALATSNHSIWSFLSSAMSILMFVVCILPSHFLNDVSLIGRNYKSKK